jgi:hypothetical protein
MMMGMMIFSASAQTGYTTVIFGSPAFAGTNQGFWRDLAYPAGMGKEPWAVGSIAEKRFMTDLSYYELAARGAVAGQALQVKICRAGNMSVFSTDASLAMGRKITEQLSLSLKLGYAISSAKGYSSRGDAMAGLGAFFMLNEKCRWAVQADGINSFFVKKNSTDQLLIRTGIGYSISSLVSLTLEIIKEKSNPVQTIVALSYKVLERLQVNLGSSTTAGTFILGVSYQHAGMDLRLSSSYHTSLGASTGISIVYYLKAAQ